MIKLLGYKRVGTKHKGFADIQTPEDLLRKMEYDLKRMKDDPYDTYAAFDFFITAEHILDWIRPSNRNKHKKVREHNELLQIVSHLANGSKHFQATAKHHKVVEGLNKMFGGFSPKAFNTRAFNVGAFKFAGLQIEKDNGSFVHAIQLAEDVYEYWCKELKKP